MARTSLGSRPGIGNVSMSVAKEHLRTIELFGAAFGFIIGVLQAIQFYIYAK